MFDISGIFFFQTALMCSNVEQLLYYQCDYRHNSLVPIATCGSEWIRGFLEKYEIKWETGLVLDVFLTAKLIVTSI